MASFNPSKIFQPLLKKKKAYGHENSSVLQRRKTIREVMEINQQTKALIEQLTKGYYAEKTQKQRVMKQFQQWKQRSVGRETELRNIISKYEKQKIVPKSGDLKTMHDEIQSKIDEENDINYKWIEDRYNENLNTMDRKIKLLKIKMEEELSKHREFSQSVQIFVNESYQDIFKEIQYTKELARSIDEENRKIHKKYNDERLRNKILVEERNMLLNDLLQKKKIIKKLNQESKKQLSHGSRFLGQPSLISPRKSSIIHKIQQTFGSSTKREEKSIDLLKKTLLRERKRNYELSTLFSRSAIKNQEINNILWQCVEQAKKDINNGQKQFHIGLIQNLAKSQNIIQNLLKLRESSSSEKQPKGM